MCRQNLLWGSVVVAFGLGMLIGAWLKSGFVTHLIGLALVFLGFAMLRRH